MTRPPPYVVSVVLRRNLMIHTDVQDLKVAVQCYLKVLLMCTDLSIDDFNRG